MRIAEPCTHPDAGGGAEVVDDDLRTVREQGLHAVSLRHRALPAREHLGDLVEGRLVEDEIDAGEAGQRLARQIVLRAGPRPPVEITS